jgi:ketosteroid isomerase-like protein
MERAADYYLDGEAVEFEEIARYVTDDLACTVEVEHFMARLVGTEERAPVTLRCTSLYRREDGEWKIVHRHADPITGPRSASSVIQS